MGFLMFDFVKSESDKDTWSTWKVCISYGIIQYSYICFIEGQCL